MNIVIGTDSESMLKRIAKELARRTTHPNATLVPDWDITNEIQHHLRQTLYHIVFEHVRGHQDKATPYNDLPLLAQLNADADGLASKHMQAHPWTTRTVPRLSHNFCQVELPVGSTNGRYKTTLRTAAHRGDIWDYLK
jgi:hypothetical protein